MNAEILYVAQLADMLGMSEAAVRAAVYRQSPAIPPAFKLGKKLAWSRTAVLAFLREKENAA
tara:strand:+ start:853 stop:1038 length:186 start_codon:yes stop_codon:yes gene_type:complete